MKNRNYKSSVEFNKLVEKYETIYTSAINVGLVLKENALRVCLQDVNVSIHKPSIKETNAKYDEEANRYIYSIISGIPLEFEKKELQEFLYNNRKVINITAKVSIQVNDKPVGTLITW